MKSEDLHAGDLVDETNLEHQFDAMDEEDLLDVQDSSSIFYGDFPPLPDFPCVSSSSSSSSTPTPAKGMMMTSTSSLSSSASSSSSSAASWAVLKSDAEEDHVEKKKGHNSNNHDHHHGDDNYDDHHAPPEGAAALSSTASMDITPPPPPSDLDISCMDVMEDFGYMDLLDQNNDIWDPSSIFHNDPHQSLQLFHQQTHDDDDGKPVQTEQDHHQFQQQQLLQSSSKETVKFEDKNHLGNYNEKKSTEEDETKDKNNTSPSDDLAMVFLEWLKSNKESISAEDLRSIKLRRSTIECAAKRLGGGKDGMKRLLKLILEWVQNHQLQGKRNHHQPSHFHSQYQDQQFQKPNPNNVNCNPNIPSDPNPCFSPSPWIPQPPYVTNPAATGMAVPPLPPPFTPMVGYMGDPFCNATSSTSASMAQSINGGHMYPPTTEYPHHMLESTQTWPPSQFALPSRYSSFADNNLPPRPPPGPQAFASYGNQYAYQYFPGNGEKLVRFGSSATKEARKKRMARQRRFLSHHRHQNQHNQQNQMQNQVVDQHARLGMDDCTNAAAQANPGNWMHWPSTAASSSPPPLVGPDAPPQMHPSDRQEAAVVMQSQNYQRQNLSSERRQGWKGEKNLRFLLQKVLKQSDVGNLGRIVLPKKEAETHLPELDARDGISIPMEDIGTSQVWNMRYRFWPNNKSRMYLLENTGEFVRANGLQEGDFIVIYSDIKCGKYMIRGVKVRQQGPKSEGKKSGKVHKNQHRTSTKSGNTLLPSLIKTNEKKNERSKIPSFNDGEIYS